MDRETFYEPTSRGFEARVRERLAYWDELRTKRVQEDG
jgi:putative ATPase